MATASLVLSAALALAMAHLGHALATRVGLRGRAAIGVGVLVGALTLLNFALANYQALGYENSILAAVVLAVCGREALIRPGSTVSLVVSAAGTLVVAHCWQRLLPPVAVAALWCAVRALRGGERWPRRAVAVLVPLTLVLGAPGVLAVVSEVGLSHAMEAGPDSPVPLILLGPGLVSAFVVAVHRRRDGATTCLAVVTMLPAVIAMVLAVGLGLDLLHYYPSKLLWQSTVLSLPWLGVLGSLAVAAGLRRVPSATNVISRLVGVPVGVVTAFAMVLPWGSQLGVWSSVDGQRVMGAVTASGASDAVVVWLEDSPTTDSITRSLIDVLRVGRTRDRAPQARVSVAQECAMLQTAASPVVLSTASEAMVRARYGCVHDVVVLHVTPAR
jgi:hypothetical protein